MLRLRPAEDSPAQDQTPVLPFAGRWAGVEPPPGIDSIRFAERALEHAEQRMRNLRRLAERFHLDLDGSDGPRAA